MTNIKGANSDQIQNNWLDQFEGNTFSQHGDDGKILKILQTIHGSQNVNSGMNWCVEFGAWDGVFNSNTFNLIKNHNYKAVLIEGSQTKFKDLQANMKAFPVSTLNHFVGFSSDTKLDALLANTEIPTDFDLLVVDIDGNDYHVWKDVQAYRPKLVVVEYNPTIPDEVEFIQEKENHLNWGSSLLSITQLAKTKGYELVTTTLNNAFYVDQKYFDLFGIRDNSLNQLHTNRSRQTYIFSGYDGTVFVRGYGVLDLHGIPFRESKFQLLPKCLRGWSDSSGGWGGMKKQFKKIYKSLAKRGIF